MTMMAQSGSWLEHGAAQSSLRPLWRSFDEIAAKHLGRVAVSCGDRQITYGELSDRAERLARHLREMGVGPEALVGVFLERSIEAIVALVAVLKAGGAYLPLDPAYPRERVVTILE